MQADFDWLRGGVKINPLFDEDVKDESLFPHSQDIMIPFSFESKRDSVRLAFVSFSLG